MASGTCGVVFPDGGLFAGIGPALYGDAEVSPFCGSQINVTNLDNNETIVVTVETECGACAENDLIVTQGAYDTFADEADASVPSEVPD